MLNLEVTPKEQVLIEFVKVRDDPSIYIKLDILGESQFEDGMISLGWIDGYTGVLELCGFVEEEAEELRKYGLSMIERNGRFYLETNQ